MSHAIHRLEASNCFDLSNHASTRSQQRGVRPSTIRLVLDYHDQCWRAKGGRHAIRISKQYVNRLPNFGIPRSTAERARGIVLIVSFRSRTVVTVTHGDRRRVWR